MKIRTAIKDTKFWICLCHNTPLSEGFYPCDSEGEQVAPTPEDWNTGWYACDLCGRIIDMKTLDIMGVRFNNTLTPKELEELYPNENRLNKVRTLRERLGLA